jgi:hypothetical protein
MSSARIHYTSNSDAKPERELDALVAVYTLALRKYRESKEAAEPAPEPDSCNGAEIVRKEEVQAPGGTAGGC